MNVINQYNRKTLWVKCIQWWCTDDDALIKNIVLVDSEIIHLPICLTLFLKTYSNNEIDDLDQSIYEMNIKYDQ